MRKLQELMSMGQLRILILILVLLVFSACGKPTSSTQNTSTGNPMGIPPKGPEPVIGSDPCQQATTSVLRDLCILVNEERAKVGASPLTVTAPLSEVAQNHAQDMSANHYFSHTGLDGRSPFDRMRDAGIPFGYAGENIAMGATTAAQVMNMWMNSSGHRANILNTGFRHFGLGYSSTYWVQTFTD